MFKTSNLYNKIHFQTNDSLTPIRDYKHDYFHSKDSRLPKFEKSQIRRLGSLKDTNLRTMKRPVSLDLSNISEPIPKRLNSPQPKIVAKNLTPKTPATNDLVRIQRFLKVLENLYDSEVEYSNNLLLVNKVYRNSLHEHTSFTNKLIKQHSADELLLFGNIDTISSISKIFVMMIKNVVHPNTNGTEALKVDWENLANNFETNGDLFSDIASTFEQHLFRCRSTYMNYASAHTKQMKLYKELRNSKLFQKWYEYCLTDAHYRTLDDLLKFPIKRIDTWVSIIGELRGIIEDVPVETVCEKLLKVEEQYLNFKVTINQEIQEFGSNPEFDFTLTPGEIIQTYDELGGFSQDIDKIAIDKLKVNNIRKSVPEQSLISESSSYYSDVSSLNIIDTIDVATKLQTNSESLNLQIGSEYSLIDNIVKFKKIHRNLMKFKLLLNKLDLFSILNTYSRDLVHWKNLLEMEPPESFLYKNNDLHLLKISAYCDNILEMKEKVTILRLTDLEVNVMTPLSTILKNCEAIKRQLRDLKTLEKDYIIYLKEKKTNVHDVKRNVIGKHYEKLEERLSKELPIFISLVNQTIGGILISYNNTILNYLEILSGGKENFQNDINQRENTIDANVSSNLDILQDFSISRSRLKRTVHNNWIFDNDPATSRVVRNLFEL